MTANATAEHKNIQGPALSANPEMRGFIGSQTALGRMGEATDIGGVIGLRADARHAEELLEFLQRLIAAAPERGEHLGHAREGPDHGVVVRPLVDLVALLAAKPAETPLTVIGAASNLIVRDGGVPPDGGAPLLARRGPFADMLQAALAETDAGGGEHKITSTERQNWMAAERMETLAALHNPDMIAGGKDVVTAMGDKRVNQSIGSQWKGRVAALDEAALEVPEAARGSTKMNAQLKRC